MDSVCNLKAWNSILDKNFSTFVVNVRDVLKDDFGIFYHLKSRLYSFVFNNLSLYSIFAHFCFFKRTCNKRKHKERCCNFCSRIYAQIFDDENVFHDIIVILFLSLMNFLRECLFFRLMFDILIYYIFVQN